MGEMSNDRVLKGQPLVLAIETATRAGGVAVGFGELVPVSIAGDPSVSHSTNLLEMVQEALRTAKVTIADVDVFAVAMGPGSFTGLRIGIATVKAFAAHLDREVAGVSSLAAVAHASRMTGNVVGLLPAGRGEVFAQLFKADDAIVTAIDEPQHLTPREVIEKYAALQDLHFTGDGVPAVKESMGERSNSYSFVSESQLLAISVAILGAREYKAGKAVAPENLHAVYVRASDAEINERWQQQKQQQQAHS
jgi:tRNA threonylcarbamoyladenosine biosynthesis protein TsaB